MVQRSLSNLPGAEHIAINFAGEWRFLISKKNYYNNYVPIINIQII